MSHDKCMTPEAIKQIEDIVNRAEDEFALSIARSLENLEARIDRMESNLYRRMNALEDTISTRCL